MFRNRATAAAAHATLNTISSFPKVKSTFSNSIFIRNLLHSNKTLPLHNNFTTISVERSDFYNDTHLNPNCSQTPQNPLAPIHYQKPSNGFYRETPNPSVFQQNTAAGINQVGQDLNFFGGGSRVSQESRQIPQNSIVGTYIGNSNEYSQNPNGFYGGGSQESQQSRQNDYSTNPQIPNVLNQGRPLGVQRSQIRAYGGNVTGEFNQNKNGYQLRPCSDMYYRKDSGGVQQVQNGYSSGNVGELNKNVNAYQVQPNANEFYREGGVGFQHNPSRLQTGVSDSLTPTNAETDNGSGESSLYAGTIEELDGYIKENKVKEAVEVLKVLEKKGITVDLSRYVMLMQACAVVGVLQYAKSVHVHLIRSAGNVKVSVCNKILEMYSKCGSMSDAYEVFDNMPERNLTSWDTMINGLARNGLGEDAIDLFTQFKEAGLKPDGQMFMGVFFACSVLYDINEGMLHFESMSKAHGIVPSMEHYVSMVNMLGSTGYLDEAKEFIEKMPIEPNVEVWETLMNMCKVHGNTELGDHCTKIVNFLDPSRITDNSKEGLLPAKASDFSIEKEKLSNNLLRKVHEYRAGDRSPENNNIYALLRRMSAQMKEAGYFPDTRFVLHDVDEESREEALLAHSERLAVAQGLITSQPRAPIRVIKNLRVCGDCHKAMKIISKIVGRLLIMRDAKRFHHFENGVCSCNDYW